MKVIIIPKSNSIIECSFSWWGGFNVATVFGESFLYSSRPSDIMTALSLQEDFSNFFKRIEIYSEEGKEKVIIVPNYEKILMKLSN